MIDRPVVDATEFENIYIYNYIGLHTMNHIIYDILEKDVRNAEAKEIDN